MQTSTQKYLGIKEWSASMRINHWAVAISIFILIVTGFYIAHPFTIYTGETVNKFFMGNVRFVHIFFGGFLIFLAFWMLFTLATVSSERSSDLMSSAMLLIFLGVIVLKLGEAVFIALLLAILIVYVMDPLVVVLQRRRLPFWLSALRS